MDDARAEAHRWVRRKRVFYTILVVYAALSVLWFAIDVLTGTDDWWFYWPMLGAGIAVGVVGLMMFGAGAFFGHAWEEREVDRYMERHRGTDSDDGDR